MKVLQRHAVKSFIEQPGKGEECWAPAAALYLFMLTYMLNCSGKVGVGVH
jgi:hypothetical protein